MTKKLSARQREINKKKRLKEQAAIAKAGEEFLATAFTEQEIKQYVHLSALFCNLSPEVTRYLYMRQREAFLLISVSLDDPSKCYDNWTLYFLRKLRKMGPEKLKELSNAYPETGLYPLVYKWIKDRRQASVAKHKAIRDEVLRKVKFREDTQKARAAEQLLLASRGREPRRKTLRPVLQ